MNSFYCAFCKKVKKDKTEFFGNVFINTIQSVMCCIDCAKKDKVEAPNLNIDCTPDYTKIEFYNPIFPEPDKTRFLARCNCGHLMELGESHIH